MTGPMTWMTFPTFLVAVAMCVSLTPC